MAKTTRKMYPKGAKHRLSDLDLDLISLVPAGDDGMARVVLAKAAPDKNPTDGDGRSTIPAKTSHEESDMAPKTDDDVISKDELPPEVVAYIEALEDELDAVSKDDDTPTEPEPSGAPDEEDEEEEDEEDSTDVEKALAKADPAVRAVIEKMQKQSERDRKRIEKAEKAAEAERTERRRRDFVTKAEQLPMISTNKDELGELLRRVDDLDPKTAEKIETLFKAANEQIRKSNLFTEVGKTGGAISIGESVDKAAKEIMGKDPKLTYEQAVAKAYDENPALYDEEVKEG